MQIHKTFKYKFTQLLEVVNWLLDLNTSNLNVGNFYGRTALHLSSANGDLDLVRLLCERGAEPNALMIFRVSGFKKFNSRLKNR